jgi:ethanolamine ammonia-lyase large subunit
VRSVETLLRTLDRMRETLDIPTQICVLAHVTTQMDALRRGGTDRSRVSVDRGDGGANQSFGVNLALLDEAWQAALN